MTAPQAQNMKVGPNSAEGATYEAEPNSQRRKI